MSNVVFLLGAGVSIPAGMPSTATITECVKSGERKVCVKSGERMVDKVKELVVRTGRDSYTFSAQPTLHQLSDEHVPTILRLFCKLLQVLRNLFGDEHDHYEALFTL